MQETPSASSEYRTVPLVRLPGAVIPVADALNDAVVVAAPDNLIVYANQATAALLGWSPAELVGQPVTTLIPNRFRAAHTAAFNRYVSTGIAHAIGHTLRVPALHADGSEVPIELVLSRLPRADGEAYLVATLRDVHERVDLEQQTVLAHHLLSVLAEGTTHGDPVPRVLAAIGETLGWDSASLWARDDGRRIRCVHTWNRRAAALATFAEITAGTRLVPGQGLPGAVWQTGEPEWITDLKAAVAIPRRDAALRAGLRCAFAFPVAANGRVVAVIELFRRTPGDPGEGLIPTMSALGERLGDFLARMEAEAERAALVERERAVAAALQRSLLPGRLPDIPGLDVAARFRPGGELVVGGDWYDIFPGAGGRWTIAVGDVCGHGPEAAALTARVRYTARALAPTTSGPATLLAHINRVLLGDDDMDRFCTAVAGSVEVAATGGTARAVLSSAGHPPPLVVRAGGDVETIDVAGTLLGVLEEATFGQVAVDLAAGDALVLYTDGVPEARGHGEWLGDDRLVTVLHRSAARSAAAIADHVLDVALDFSDGDPGDDIAVLVLRVEPKRPLVPGHAEPGVTPSG